jgi:hypothetical protein
VVIYAAKYSRLDIQANEIEWGAHENINVSHPSCPARPIVSSCGSP